MLIGYARVSTTDQNLDLQKDALEKAGCEKIFSDTVSGSKSDRPGLKDVLKFARTGDTVLVWRLDRLGRSIKHLIETVQLFHDRDIGFKCLQGQMDTTTSGGKLIFHVFAALAEFESDIIRERTQAGLTAARARGRLGGRPRAMDAKKANMAKTLYQDKSNSIQRICEILKISRSTLYKYVSIASENEVNGKKHD